MPGQIVRNFEGGFLVKVIIVHNLFFSIFPLTNLMTCCFFLTVPESYKLAEIGENYVENGRVDSSNPTISKFLRDTNSKPTAINNLEVK